MLKNKLLGIIFLITAIGFNLEAQTRDIRPAAPQPMSAKTAMQYFTDEGILIGINHGNSLDAFDIWTPPYNPDNPIAVETVWRNPIANQVTFNGIKALGFQIVRIPVTWMGHIGPAPDYIISESYLRRVAEVVGYAENAGLKAIINIHHDGNFSHGANSWFNFNHIMSGNASVTDKYEKVWKQIADYFKNYGDWLMFQGFNEIHNGNWDHGNARQYQVINNLNQIFTNAVRGTGGNNSQRYLLYYGYNTSHTIAGNNYRNFSLPTDSAGLGRQIVGFHFYFPYEFTMLATTHTWDNRENRRNIDNSFAAFKTNFIDRGIPVIIGEFGAARYIRYASNSGSYRAANAPAAHQNRLNYIEYFVRKARENGLVPIYWDSGHSYHPELDPQADFGLINRNNGQPRDNESAEVIQRMINAVR
ncbi:MAG: glycoside hydrolase family 5 protein [Treponema sp.]|nr:glycoside hydrolase family 5 protein [Treponema sp.]